MLTDCTDLYLKLKLFSCSVNRFFCGIVVGTFKSLLLVNHTHYFSSIFPTLNFHKKNGLFIKTVSQNHFRVLEIFLVYCMIYKEREKMHYRVVLPNFFFFIFNFFELYKCRWICRIPHIDSIYKF